MNETRIDWNEKARDEGERRRVETPRCIGDVLVRYNPRRDFGPDMAEVVLKISLDKRIFIGPVRTLIAKEAFDACGVKLTKRDDRDARIQNQREEIRRLQKRLNDVTQSRDHWKREAERTGKQLFETLNVKR